MANSGLPDSGSFENLSKIGIEKTRNNLIKKGWSAAQAKRKNPVVVEVKFEAGAFALRLRMISGSASDEPEERRRHEPISRRDGMS